MSLRLISQDRNSVRHQLVLSGIYKKMSLRTIAQEIRCNRSTIRFIVLDLVADERITKIEGAKKGQCSVYKLTEKGKEWIGIK